MAFGKAETYTENENITLIKSRRSQWNRSGKAPTINPKKEDVVCQENGAIREISEVKGCGFDMEYLGEGVYMYHEGRWKEKIDSEKIKKIKRRIVDKVFKSTPIEALQFAYNNNLICEKLFE